MKLPVWLVFVIVINGSFSCFSKQGVAAKKPAALKNKRDEIEIAETEVKILHGTHHWTLRNIFALESTEVNEVSSQPFKVVFRRGDNEFTYK